MDYYEILGVSRSASTADIKKAYRNLSKEWHPDKHPSTGSGQAKKEAERKYKEINRAYEALRDPKKKQAYDQFGNEDGPQFGGGGSPFGQGFEGGLSDIFETFFSGGRSARSADVQGRDVEIALTISLSEAFTGTKKKIRIKKRIACEKCSGSGAEKGSKKVSCSQCSGTGQVTRTAQSFFGMIQQSIVCDVCKGSGKVPEKPCSFCAGEGRMSGSEEVTVEIPSGIHDGQTLRIRGKGEAGRQGVASGDLYVSLRIMPDPRFVRDGDDLRTEVHISVADAVLGTEVKVETFAGPITLKVPAGTQPNQVLRVKGKGMPILSSSRHGDLYVKVKVDVPKKVGRKERKLWEDLRG